MMKKATQETLNIDYDTWLSHFMSKENNFIFVSTKYSYKTYLSMTQNIYYTTIYPYQSVIINISLKLWMYLEQNPNTQYRNDVLT